MKKCLIITRPSISKNLKHSRSVHSRLIDPSLELTRNSLCRFDIVDEVDGKEFLDSGNYYSIIFSKHKSDEGLQLARYAKNCGVKVLYDIDELITSYPGYSNINISKKELGNIGKFIELADLTTVSTNRLRDSLSEKFSGNFVVIPTTFDFYQAMKSTVEHAAISVEAGKKFKILMVNGDSLKLRKDKNNFKIGISKFLEENGDKVELDLISDQNDVIDNNYENFRYLGPVSWDAYRELLLSNDYELAITPLAGNEEPENLEYNSCKTPIKYIEYGGYQIPGLYSSTPIYSDLIIEGKTGFLIQNSESWYLKLTNLLEMRKSLPEVGKNAKHDVCERFSLQKIALNWQEVLFG
jgi:glycosyltransferase involved in cell wall biosynthesis